MTTGYTKLFSSILTSSLWAQEDSDTRIVWITMLALANRDGVVEASIPGLASQAKVSIKSVEKALNVFLSPDPYSRNEANDGRRIRKVAEGWLILNFVEYRSKMNEIERKAYNAAKQAEYRHEKKQQEAVAAAIKHQASIEYPE